MSFWLIIETHNVDTVDEITGANNPTNGILSLSYFILDAVNISICLACSISRSMFSRRALTAAICPEHSAEIATNLSKFSFWLDRLALSVL